MRYGNKSDLITNHDDRKRDWTSGMAPTSSPRSNDVPSGEQKNKKCKHTLNHGIVR